MANVAFNPPQNVWYGVKHDSLNKWKINYLGTIATVADLPESGTFKGDTYNIAEDGTNWMWNGESWDRLDSILYFVSFTGDYVCNTQESYMDITAVRGNESTYQYRIDMSELRAATDSEVDSIFV